MTPAKFVASPLNTLFDNFFRMGFDDQFAPARTFSRPAVNVKETENAFEVELAAPGMEKGDFNLKVENNALIVSASKKQETEQTGTQWKHREFSYTSFTRSFTLPETVDADNITAAYTNGILSLVLPKKAETKPAVKTIEIG